MSEARARPAELDELVAGVLAGDRTLLGRAITLVESTAPAHAELAQQVLEQLLPHTGRAIRVGISGAPGVGKSTLIEALGTHLTASGRRVAVLAVDPSSPLSGGSILGDKTRMPRLSSDALAFVRPSPSGSAVGGVARATREVLLLVEAAGYEVVLVETVGVGQSDVAVRHMVDFFLLLMLAGAGDELQGIKRGAIELADALAITKADGDNQQAAEQARAQYASALQYLAPTAGWKVEVVGCSALSGVGIDLIWQLVERHRAHALSTGLGERRRREQALHWMHAILTARLAQRMRAHPRVAELLPEIERQVEQGILTPTAAAQRLLRALDAPS
jgi:LAO/AO transport system kinase